MFGRALKNMVFTRSMSQQASPINVDALKIIHEPSAKCFVMKLNSDSATVTYEKEGNIYNLLESEVPESLRGKGFGTILAKVLLIFLIDFFSLRY